MDLYALSAVYQIYCAVVILSIKIIMASMGNNSKINLLIYDCCNSGNESCRQVGGWWCENESVH